MPGRKSHTLIPPKAQIPLMIGGLILLAAILTWRLSGLRRDEGDGAAVEASAPASADPAVAAPAQATPVAAAAPGLSPLSADPADQLTELQSRLVALGEVRRRLSGKAAEESVLAPEEVARPLSRNPFVAPPKAVPEKEASAMGKTAAAEPRGKRLSDLRLRGTVVSGSIALANFNGETYSVGDSVRGFVIRRIDPMSAIISDDQSTEVVRMEGTSQQ